MLRNPIPSTVVGLHVAEIQVERTAVGQKYSVRKEQGH